MPFATWICNHFVTMTGEVMGGSWTCHAFLDGNHDCPSAPMQSSSSQLCQAVCRSCIYHCLMAGNSLRWPPLHAIMLLLALMVRQWALLEQDADMPPDLLQPLTLKLHEFSSLTSLTKLSILLGRFRVEEEPATTVELADSLTGRSTRERHVTIFRPALGGKLFTAVTACFSCLQPVGKMSCMHM